MFIRGAKLSSWHKSNSQRTVLINRKEAFIVAKFAEDAFDAINLGTVIRVIARKNDFRFSPLKAACTYGAPNCPDGNGGSILSQCPFQIVLTPVGSREVMQLGRFMWDLENGTRDTVVFVP